ncbi:TLC domain-containing protein 4-A-like [Symsagittifera roscoffensis]|uniref:TLC domain-containing protein 4-A-like n=1 Tax=Symsagittifera roscoffensis TaxID=84072 RepID=UPI00307CB1AD
MSASAAEILEPPLGEITNHNLATELTWDYYENILKVCVPFTLLYLFIVPALSLRLFPVLKLHSQERRCSFVSDFVSMIPSILSSFITVRSFIYFVPVNDRDQMFEGYKWVTIYMQAYLLLDTFYRLLYIESNRAMMVIHHIVGLVITQFAMHDRGWLMEKLVFCLMEVANPFINLRFLMLGVDVPKTSNTYLSASLIMIISFFLFRILPIPYIYRGGIYKLILYPQYGSWAHFWMFTLYVLLSLMNIYWFYVMLLGLHKTFIRKSKPEEGTHRD